MYHCEFCGEMQLAGVTHIAPQFPSQWEEPFPKLEEISEDCNNERLQSAIAEAVDSSLAAPSITRLSRGQVSEWIKRFPHH